MGIISDLLETGRLRTEIGALRDSMNIVQENAVQTIKQLAAENIGWKALGQATEKLDAATLASEGDRVEAAALLNPLLKRGATVRAGYIHGQGIEISARDQTINEVVQAFLDDEANSSIVGLQAAIQREHKLFTRGEYAVALFTNPLTGRVKVRPVSTREIVDIITDPEDVQSRRYYRREWTQKTLTPDGRTVTSSRAAYYPDVHYQPAMRPREIDGVEVMWDAPIVHKIANPVGDDGLRGIGDAYPCLPWSNAHTGYLRDFTDLASALSKIAYKASAVTPATAARLQAQLGQLSSLPSGSSHTGTQGVSLEAVTKTGANIDPEGGRVLASMVAAGLGLPVTVLLADPGVTGARATAQTLDKPMILEMKARQELHTEFWQDILGYVIEAAAYAPQGALRSLMPSLSRDEDRLIIDLGDIDQTVEISWPDIEDIDRKTELEALAIAHGMQLVPDEEILKLVLHVLGVRDADEIVNDVTDDNGNILTPGQVAAEALALYRRGESL